MSQRGKIWGYLRVSTDKQDAAAQRREIEIWANGQKVYWIEDVASGKKKHQRPRARRRPC